ncbi:protein-L-isoaspartate(D-aspartate) O-methyltransferase [Accumulibacter sp.]|uniref:protein-L-isoaspartate(D-aspartate) O-methyltransferase n=1 Tax=Accumulibacter sp. TaxID=2053492 RepID=UPI0025D97691|nr:protein-L-isoaspartate(D-aspartate) O-methyltransferase [Accumulibacter sp.]MCM8597010.1 protein-L-isoaspartate(D-aspartate) O-methyltransferase [Accumulibacter sp.]MCM8626244.1 protein-L-isoaspartate(D-aspartate) O-methyltransferase [Accumulibacter sp.]MDS4051159.1 protein-L-isoaspartate(D-aspartate) O-methyltransferase [Accumulibacter sp.]
MAEDRDWEVELLLDEIRDEVRATAHLTGRSVLDRRVFDALRAVPRRAFVPVDLAASAYANHPLPIGHGQTISQPYIVALMSDLIRPEPDDVVLEVGTGSGYQTAVLACLVRQVYSVEIIDALAEQARRRLQRMGFDNVEVRSGDGGLGWPEHAPYDAIMVTAAARSVPPALIEQLRPGGTLVIPVGSGYFGQELITLGKDEAGQVSERRVLPVAFVPLTGGASD